MKQVGHEEQLVGRGQCLYDPWHYVPVLARKPGALRNGAPFKNWLLPANLERVRHKLNGSNDGDRQMVAILSAVLADGLPAVEAACGEALDQGVHSADVVLNILARQRDHGPPATILTPAALTLRHALHRGTRVGIEVIALAVGTGRATESRIAKDGPDQPGYEEMIELARSGRCWLKLTGPYRFAEAPEFKGSGEMVRKLTATVPDRLIWGTDHPHLSFADKVGSVRLFNLLGEWIPDEAVRRRVLTDNPARLFGFQNT